MSKTFSLGVHASWRCQHSGACCSSNWAIDIDAPRADRIGAAVRDRIIPLAVASDPARAPFETQTQESHPIILGRTAQGACVFHDAEAHRCRVHAALGHDALPLACRQFPRVSLIDPRGVRVSLSHYCPSAIARLFSEDDDDERRGDEAALTVVDNPESFPADGEYDGLDARHAFPPLLRPGVLMDWKSVDALERYGVELFAAETVSPDAALARFAAACEAIRGWRVDDGPMIERVRAVISAQSTQGDDAPGAAPAASYQQHAPAIDSLAIDWSKVLERDAEVRAADPTESHRDDAAAMRALVESYHTHVGPVWPAFTRPICRYLAARLFGSWCWYQGQGLRSLVRSLDAASSVLRIECARQTRDSGRMLDRHGLREAIRQTDLRLLHLASREALAARWSAAERDERA